MSESDTPPWVCRRAWHLYRMYAVLKAACTGRPMRLLLGRAGPFAHFLLAARNLAEFEAGTDIPVDDTVFVLSVFAHYGKETWPPMFRHRDVLTHYQRYERRTAQERVADVSPAAALAGKIAVAWGVSVEEAKRRFGPLLAPRP